MSAATKVSLGFMCYQCLPWVCFHVQDVPLLSSPCHPHCPFPLCLLCLLLCPCRELGCCAWRRLHLIPPNTEPSAAGLECLFLLFLCAPGRPPSTVFQAGSALCNLAVLEGVCVLN